MRVVAGRAGGILLEVPRGGTVRPTMDRVKAAIFSSLAGRVPGARVLDLFAGSGALGIEALSRGAGSAIFVEKDRRAAEAIERNLAKTRLAGEIRRNDFHDFLSRAAPESFDLIFADPPYAKKIGERDFGAELLKNESLARSLAPDGIFVLEKMPGAKFDPAPLWECVRLKRYGATEVAFLIRANIATT